MASAWTKVLDLNATVLWYWTPPLLDVVVKFFGARFGTLLVISVWRYLCWKWSEGALCMAGWLTMCGNHHVSTRLTCHHQIHTGKTAGVYWPSRYYSPSLPNRSQSTDWNTEPAGAWGRAGWRDGENCWWVRCWAWADRCAQHLRCGRCVRSELSTLCSELSPSCVVCEICYAWVVPILCCVWDLLCLSCPHSVLCVRFVILVLSTFCVVCEICYAWVVYILCSVWNLLCLSCPHSMLLNISVMGDSFCVSCSASVWLGICFLWGILHLCYVRVVVYEWSYIYTTRDLSVSCPSSVIWKIIYLWVSYICDIRDLLPARCPTSLSWEICCWHVKFCTSVSFVICPTSLLWEICELSYICVVRDLLSLSCHTTRPQRFVSFYLSFIYAMLSLLYTYEMSNISVMRQ